MIEDPYMCCCFSFNQAKHIAAFIPLQTLFVEGILFSRCPSIRLSIKFCFLNILKSLRLCLYNVDIEQMHEGVWFKDIFLTKRQCIDRAVMGPSTPTTAFD